MSSSRLLFDRSSMSGERTINFFLSFLSRQEETRCRMQARIMQETGTIITHANWIGSKVLEIPSPVYLPMV